jgi:DNA-binding ferritin-like protein
MKEFRTFTESINLPSGNTDIINVGQLLFIIEQSRIFHWQTPSYAEHKALGKFYEGLEELIDSFAESAMGQVGVPRGGNWSLDLRNYGEYPLDQFMDDVMTEFKGMKREVSEDMSDLQNILDEMIAVTTRTRYLLHLQG